MADYTGQTFIRESLAGEQGKILKNAVETGQHPWLLLIHAGSGSSLLVDEGVAKVFAATVTPDNLAAAADYSADHLGTKKAFIFLTEKDLEEGVFTDGIDIKGKTSEEVRELAIGWLHKQAQETKKHFHWKDSEGNKCDGDIVCGFLSKDKLTLLPFKETLDDMKREATEVVGDFGLIETIGKHVSCSCCDSRAEHQNLYCEEVGESIAANTIGGFLTEEAMRKAYDKGVRSMSFTGHSKCGGMNGLVNYLVHGKKKDPGPNLKKWLDVVGKETQQAIDFAKEKGVLFDADGNISPIVFTLAEMWATQRTGLKAIRVFGKENVTTNYYDIVNPQVYALNPYETIEKTFENAKDVSKLPLPTAESKTISVKAIDKAVQETRKKLVEKLNEVFTHLEKGKNHSASKGGLSRKTRGFHPQ